MTDLLAPIFKALGEATRLDMLGLLILEGELCVCEIMGALGITQSKASRHLRYLYHAGLVESRRAGAWVHYRLPDEPSPEHRAVLRLLREILTPTLLEPLRQRLVDWWDENPGYGERNSRCERAS